MFAEQRKTAIIELINSNSSVSLNELMDTFEVSETTIRRDLTELENEGELTRTHGGAIASTKSTFEPNYTEKENENFAEKESIASVVASMVKPGETILLDAGTTTVQIARALSSKRITLITNSAIIASNFIASNTEMEIHSTGGLFRAHTNSFVGAAAENYLRQIRPDKAFIATNGISLDSGATTAHLLEASIKKTMIAVAKQVFLVADHSKFGKEYFSVIERADAFDGIISDKWISQQVVEQFKDKGIPIIKVNLGDDLG